MMSEAIDDFACHGRCRVAPGVTNVNKIENSVLACGTRSDRRTPNIIPSRIKVNHSIVGVST